MYINTRTYIYIYTHTKTFIFINARINIYIYIFTIKYNMYIIYTYIRLQNVQYLYACCISYDCIFKSKNWDGDGIHSSQHCITPWHWSHRQFPTALGILKLGGEPHGASQVMVTSSGGPLGPLGSKGTCLHCHRWFLAISNLMIFFLIKQQ